MITLQQYLNQKYPTKEEKEKVREINSAKMEEERRERERESKFEGGELDLRGFVNVERLILTTNFLNSSFKSPLTKINLNNFTNLRELCCTDEELNSVDF